MSDPMRSGAGRSRTGAGVRSGSDSVILSSSRSCPFRLEAGMRMGAPTALALHVDASIECPLSAITRHHATSALAPRRRWESGRSGGQVVRPNHCLLTVLPLDGDGLLANLKSTLVN